MTEPAAPATSLAVCNLALDLLEEDAVTSIESPTTETEAVCARWYPAVRRAVYRKHVWNWALKRAALAPAATAPIFGYGTAYDLPADFIRLVSIGDDYLMDLKTKYQVEGGQLLYGADASTDSLNIRYIFDQVTVTKMDPCFIDVLATELAIRIAKKITGDSSGKIIASLKDHLKLIAPEAYAIDGQERPPIRIQRSRLIAARRGYSSGSVASPDTVFPE
jgi:hypothetical protein